MIKFESPMLSVTFGPLLVSPKNTCLFILSVRDMGTVRLQSGSCPHSMYHNVLYYTLRNTKPLRVRHPSRFKKKRERESRAENIMLDSLDMWH